MEKRSRSGADADITITSIIMNLVALNFTKVFKIVRSERSGLASRVSLVGLE